MKGMIFAAGLGTRLAPLTDTMPKALVEVGGQTMLERAIRRLTDAGVTEITVNTHHFAYMVEEYLEGHDGFGAHITISRESDRLLDTGGGVVAAGKWLTAPPDEPIMLYNADILTDFDINAMLGAHLRSGADATLLVSDTRKSTRGLIFGPDGRMAGWTNLQTGEVRAPRPLPEGAKVMPFGGVHIISPRLIADMEEYGRERDGVFSLTPFYTAVCGARDLHAYLPESPYRWIDIGKPETLALARKLFEAD